MNRGVIVSGIVGIIIIAITVILISNFTDTENEDVEVLTGTPADNYPEKDKKKFCGTSDAKSTKYINEYLIPTDCTQPQAIVTSQMEMCGLLNLTLGNYFHYLEF